MNTQITEQFITLPNITLRVLSAGSPDAPLVIFLHGFPDLAESWQAQLLAAAAAGFYALAPDQRGYNLSGKPKGLDAYGMNALTGDVLALADWAGAEQFDLVGHDWGANVAWYTALQHGARVRRLGIVNVPHPTAFEQFFRKHPSQILKSWYVFWFQLPRLPEFFAGKVGPPMLRWSSRPGTFDDETLAVYGKAWSQPGAWTGMINWYRAYLRRRNLTPVEHPQLSMPVLIIWGEGDQFLDKRLAADSLAFCENGRCELLPGVSHWVMHEEPEKTNALLIPFLSK